MQYGNMPQSCVLNEYKAESRGTFFEHTLEHTRFCQTLQPCIFNGSSVHKRRVRVPCPPPSTKDRLNACFFVLIVWLLGMGLEPERAGAPVKKSGGLLSSDGFKPTEKGGAERQIAWAICVSPMPSAIKLLEFQHFFIVRSHTS